MTIKKQSSDNNLSNPMTVEEALSKFLSNSENERLFRESEIRLDVSEYMRAIRKAQDITQEALAERVGCSQPFIAKLEKGAYDRLGLANLRTYARALGYDINTEALFYPIGASVYTGYSSALSLQEALANEEMLSPKIATLFAASGVSGVLSFSARPDTIASDYSKECIPAA